MTNCNCSSKPPGKPGGFASSLCAPHSAVLENPVNPKISNLVISVPSIAILLFVLFIFGCGTRAVVRDDTVVFPGVHRDWKFGMSFSEFIADNKGEITNVHSRVRMVTLESIRDSNGLLNITSVFFVDNFLSGVTTVYTYLGRDAVTTEAFTHFQEGVRVESYRIFGDKPEERGLPGPNATNDFREFRWNNDFFNAFLGLPGKRSEMTKLELVGTVSIIETAYGHKTRTGYSLDMLQLPSIMNSAAKFPISVPVINGVRPFG